MAVVEIDEVKDLCIMNNYKVNDLFRQSYEILKAKESSSVDTKFEKEARFRNSFNSVCISYIKQICDQQEKNNVSLPSGYTKYSIAADCLSFMLELHRRKRAAIFRGVKVVIKPLAYLKSKRLVSNEVLEKSEKYLFVFLSDVHIFIVSTRYLLVNIFRLFSKQKIELSKNNKLGDEPVLICANFPWYSFVNQTDRKGAEKIHFKVTDTFGLSDYILSDEKLSKMKVLSIGEYDLPRFDSSIQLHEKCMLEREVLKRSVTDIFTFFKQASFFLKNMSVACRFFSSLHTTSFFDKIIFLILSLRYFTHDPDIFYAIKKISEARDVRLLLNANSFYNYPWCGSMVMDKSYYMYADNCCYFPFAYFSPSKNFVESPELSKSEVLLFGFLEWQLYFRVAGRQDVGYKGVNRLTFSLNQKENIKNIGLVNYKSHPLQLGSIKHFNSEKNTVDLKEILSDVNNKKILFLDANTADTKEQFSIFDVPNHFISSEVATIYYKALIEFVLNNNTTVFIRPKHRVNSMLNNIIDEILGELNASKKDKVVVVSPHQPLQELLAQIKPDILLLRPMSSTYLFTKELDYLPYYFIPKKLQAVFNRLENKYVPAVNESIKPWVNEQDISDLLSERH